MIHGAEPLVSLPAHDVPRAIRFYTESLGMRLLFSAPDHGFCLFGGDRDIPTTIGVHHSAKPIPRVEEQDVWMWLQVDDVHAMSRELESRSVRLVGEIVPRGPGHEQAFLDSEGNLLRLWARINELRRSIDIAATPEAVFAMLSSADSIAQWFELVDHVELEQTVGGRISFVDSVFGVVVGRVTAFDPPYHIAFEFDENWPRTLDIRVEPAGDAVRVHVHQCGFDTLADRDYGIPGLIARLDRGLAVFTTRSAISWSTAAI
jgi:uncharacterized protein YndB with AHSA1/START domain/predicted enzyme related to lactoylglutathione lyase